MNIKRILVLLALIALTLSSAKAQSAPSMPFGSTTITFGEPVTAAISALSSMYTVDASPANSKSPAPKQEEWLIFEKLHKDQMPPATLYARSGRVSGFSAMMEPFDESSSQDIFNSFFALVDQLTKERRNTCILTSGASYLGGPMPLDKKFIDFACGPYDFYLLKSEFHNEKRQLVTGFLMVEQIGDTSD